MDDVLALTIIPNLADRYVTESNLDWSTTGDIHGEDENDRNDMMIWYNNIGSTSTEGGGATVAYFAHRAHDRIHQFVSGKKSPEETIIDGERLAALGMPTEYVKQFLQRSILASDDNRKVSRERLTELAYLGIYLNTVGAMPNVLEEALSQFFSDHVKGRQQNQSKKTAEQIRAEMKARANVPNVEALNDTQLAEICQAASTPQESAAMMEEIIQDTINNISRGIRNLATATSFNSETILNAISYQYLEPTYAIDVFTQLAGNATLVNDTHRQTLTPAARYGTKRLDDVLRSRVVSLVGNQLAKLCDELYNIVLPRQYRLHHGMSTASLDVLLPVLYGANTKLIRKIHEIVTFHVYATMDYSDGVLEAIRQVEEMNEQTRDERDVWKVLVREWSRQAAFVIFLQLCRALCPAMNKLSVGCTDEFTVPGDTMVVSQRDGGMREKRVVPDNHIYYSEGTYYLQWTHIRSRDGEFIHEPRRFTSPDYRRLLELYWLDMNFSDKM